MARPTQATAATKRVLAALARRQLLLQSGNELASVANIVAGEEVRGSWWAEHRTGSLPEADDSRAHLEQVVGDASRLLPWR
jgi:hypothetical protein